MIDNDNVVKEINQNKENLVSTNNENLELTVDKEKNKDTSNKEKIVEVIDYLDPKILDVKKYTFEEISSMNIENEEKLSDDESKMYDSGNFANISEKQLVEGVVVAINDKEVLIDIGFKSEGIIDKNEFSTIPHVGDTVEVFLVVFEDKRGRLILSKVRADFEKRWKELRDAAENDSILQGKIIKIIKGGMVVDLGVVNAFLPGSQVDVKPVSDFGEFLNKDCDFKIVKFNEFRQNIVVSRKATMVDELSEKRNQLLANLQVGSDVQGTVKNITDFGAFIDLGGGIDGLLHITDITWGRINHPTDKLTIGENLTVKVIDFDKEKNRISLGLKQLSPDPWGAAFDKYKEKTTIKGKIVNMMNYGVFVEIEDGIEGLIHISEISWTKHIKHPSEIYKLGDIIEAMVISIDVDTKKISLGIKQMISNPWLTIDDKYKTGDKCSGTIINLVQNGAYINLNSEIEGFLHINDISWTRKIKNIKDIFKKNQKLDVVILELSSNDKKINLGLKQLTDDPWIIISKYYKVKDNINAKVLHILEKGIIFLTEDDFECILPISKIKDKSYFKINSDYDLIISEINDENRRIVLKPSSTDITNGNDNSDKSKDTILKDHDTSEDDKNKDVDTSEDDKNKDVDTSGDDKNKDVDTSGDDKNKDVDTSEDDKNKDVDTSEDDKNLNIKAKKYPKKKQKNSK